MPIKWSTLKTIKALLAFLVLVAVLIAAEIVIPFKNTNDMSISNYTDNSLAEKISNPPSINAFVNNEIAKPLAEIKQIEFEQTNQARINSLVEYLTMVNSPINSVHYASLIISLANANGVDYRIVVALMGTESGWCKKPIYFNCFGYLNGAHYTSFDDAFNHLIPKISKQYFIRYGWDFAGFVEEYGQLDPVSAYNYGRNMYSIADKLYY